MRVESARFWVALASALAAGLAGACARQGAPPGGPEDRRPPVVVSTFPDTFAVLTEPFRGPVRFDFDERISERVASGTLDQAVVVSPRTGRVRVGHGRQSISVEVDGGFRPGLVYRITLLPVVRDLFNNQLFAPSELVFSTGGDFNASAVAGTAWDRVTAEGLDALEVMAIPVESADTIPHVARTDTGGVYVFRYLPPARYRLVAFQDRNRNGLVDRMELQGERSFEVAGADTSFVDVAVLQPDTTPARLTRAVVVDSVTVVVEFDDYLDPMAAAALMGVTLTSDSTGALVPAQVLHEREYVAWVAQLQDSFARLDSLEARQRADEALEDIPLSRDTLRADTAAADTLEPAAPPPPVARPVQTTRPLPASLPVPTSGGGRPAAPPPRGPGGRQEEVLAPDGRPLPARRLVLRLEESLVINAAYKVSAGSVVNIAGTGGGGGEAAVIRQAPRDTASVPDSLAVPDTAAPDTSAVPPDTGRVARGLFWPLPERRR
ncbi:MAG: Ig-like domain-containing protein [Longimicrobiales bacterium]|nr:Ig-like domain-containing protein [Longimicrobiales bacterium]